MNEKKFAEKMNHQNEIEQTRVGGFGGSDANLFAKIAIKGMSSLSQTDRRRIAVAKGLVQYTPIPTNSAMEAGHKFEDYMGELLPYGEREVKIEQNLSNDFATFAHADIVEKGVVYECKYSQSYTEEVIDRYYYQLQWYYMLGAEKVRLIHGWGNVEPFEVVSKEVVDIPIDQSAISTLREGISILSEAWDDFDFVESQDVYAAELDANTELMVNEFSHLLSSIKMMEDKAETLRSKVLELMQTYGIKNIKGDGYTLSYVAETTSNQFDKKRLFAEHPEINELDYIKQVKRCANVRISLK